MNRFYLNQDLIPKTDVYLSDEEEKHLRVLRVREGEAVEIVNGHGVLAKATLLKRGTLSITQILRNEKRHPLALLAIGMPRRQKVEWIIEKGTELGADSFLLFPCERSEQELPSHTERLHALAVSAMKQSGRLFLPTFQLLSSLNEAVRASPFRLFGDVRTSAPLLIDEPLPSAPLFFTGPEGGFTKEEITLLENSPAKGVKLHENILRAETAPLAALSVLYQKRSSSTLH